MCSSSSRRRHDHHLLMMMMMMMMTLICCWCFFLRLFLCAPIAVNAFLLRQVTTTTTIRVARHARQCPFRDTTTIAYNQLYRQGGQEDLLHDASVVWKNVHEDDNDDNLLVVQPTVRDNNINNDDDDDEFLWNHHVLSNAQQAMVSPTQARSIRQERERGRKLLLPAAAAAAAAAAAEPVAATAASQQEERSSSPQTKKRMLGQATKRNNNHHEEQEQFASSTLFFGKSHDKSRIVAAAKRRQTKTTKSTTKTTTTTRRQKGMNLSYNVTIQALRAYHARHGDLVMPRRFIVPSDQEDDDDNEESKECVNKHHNQNHNNKSRIPPYPPEWHGLDLSSTVYTMKWWQDNVKQQSERVVELSQLGFVWARLQPEWNIVLEALITYASLFGDLLVPNKFVVPHNDTNWPMATWGIPLGNCVYRIRTRDDFLRGSQAASRREQLDGLGFVWDVQEYRFRKFYVALRIFAHVKGCGQYCRDRIHPLLVPSNFVIPEQSPPWPQDLWNYPLGVKCTAVRQKQLYIKDNPERKALLDELGFHWSGNTDLGWLKVVHAAAIYSRLNARRLDVPLAFVVPRPPGDTRDDNHQVGGGGGGGADWPWPEYLWGLPLGQRLKDVRVKGAYLHQGESGEKRRRQLDALGFNWNPRRGRRPQPKVTQQH